MAQSNDHSSSAKQKYFKLVAPVVLIGVIVVVVWSQFRDDPITRNANSRVFVCVETGKHFSHDLEPGELEPIESPFTGRRTAWMAEACYWSKGENGEWKAKKEPTYVVLKKRMGIDEKTYCPDCGREVVGHNPLPPKELMDAAE